MNLPTIQIPGRPHYIVQVDDTHLTVSSLTPDLLSSVYYFLHSYGKVEKDDILQVVRFYPKSYYIDALGSMWFSIFKNAINELAISFYDNRGIDIRSQVEESND